MRRLFASIVSVVVALAVTTAQGAPAPRLLGPPSITKSFNSASIAFQMSASSKVMLQLSTDGQTFIPVMWDGSKAAHQLDISGLRPATQYYCRLLAAGKAISACDFKTDPVQPAEAKIAGGRILLDGVPTFAIIANVSTVPCPDPTTNPIIGEGLKTGAFMLFGRAQVCLPPLAPSAELARQLDGRAWWFEGNQKAVAQIKSQGLLPELLDLVLSPEPGDPGSVKMHYSINPTSCNDRSIHGLYRSVRKDVSSGQPVVDQITISSKLTPSRASCLTPQYLSAVVWTDAQAGASGVQYVTDYPWLPVAGFHVDPQIQQAGMQLALQLAAIEPMLFGSRAAIKLIGSGPVTVGAYRYKGVTLVIAVNPGNTAAKAKLKIAGLGKKQVQVYREATSVATWQPAGNRKAKASIFTDRFEPFGVHFYIVW